jgi:UDP-N-acetylmuramoyl-L-alanyl-D-glutamate--2,6-diaminopimelate ligase
MAEIASQLSNKLILTSDNPRFEKPEAILDDMIAGVDVVNRRKTLIIPDRKEAIKTACIMAKTGDVILVAGKGHEKYQEIEGVKHPFDDRKVVNEIFKTYE